MINKYSDINILVIGDSCIDIFKYGSVPRLAPEGPAPIFNPLKTVSNGGMALNVKSNIIAIGADAQIITQSEKIYKTRYVDERTNSLLMRVDEEQKVSEISKEIINNVRDNKFEEYKFDALIISDYCKGFLSEDNIYLLSKNNENVFLDTKKILGAWCKLCKYIKINHVEFERTKHTIETLDLYHQLIITHSDKGCEFQKSIYPVEKVNCKDMSGAGDTFVSGLTCEFARTKNIIEAIKFAQDCATQVVQKLGVCTI